MKKGVMHSNDRKWDVPLGNRNIINLMFKHTSSYTPPIYFKTQVLEAHR